MRTLQVLTTVLRRAHLPACLALLVCILPLAGCTDDTDEPGTPIHTGLPLDLSSIRMASTAASSSGTSTPGAGSSGFFSYDTIYAGLTCNGVRQEAKLVNIGSSLSPVWKASRTLYWQSASASHTLTLRRGGAGDFTLPDDMGGRERIKDANGNVIDGVEAVHNYTLHDRLFLRQDDLTPSTSASSWELQHSMAQIVVLLSADPQSPVPTADDLLRARVSITLPCEGNFDAATGVVSRRTASAGGATAGKSITLYGANDAQTSQRTYLTLALPGLTPAPVITITIPATIGSAGRAEQVYRYTAPQALDLKPGCSHIFRLRLGTRVSALSITADTWQTPTTTGPGLAEAVIITDVAEGGLAASLAAYTGSSYGAIQVSGALSSDDYQALARFIKGQTSPVSLEIEATGGSKTIPEQAFKENEHLASVVLKGITTVGKSAFDGSSLTSIVLPEGLQEIGEEAFIGCAALKSANVPSTVTTWGRSTFASSGLTSVTLAEGLTMISISTFKGCKALTDITIPASVTTLGNNAFDGSGLTSITFVEPAPSAVTKLTAIPTAAFQNCTALTDITLPSSITSLGRYAFNDCTALTGIVLPEAMESIGEGAFAGCTALHGVARYDSKIWYDSSSVGTDAFKETPTDKELFVVIKGNEANATEYQAWGKTTWAVLHSGYKSGAPLDPDNYYYHYKY